MDCAKAQVGIVRLGPCSANQADQITGECKEPYTGDKRDNWKDMRFCQNRAVEKFMYQYTDHPGNRHGTDEGQEQVVGGGIDIKSDISSCHIGSRVGDIEDSHDSVNESGAHSGESVDTSNYDSVNDLL